MVACVEALICWIAWLFNRSCICVQAGFIASEAPACCSNAPAAVPCAAGAITLASDTTSQLEPGPPGPISMVSAYTYASIGAPFFVHEK